MSIGRRERHQIPDREVVMRNGTPASRRTALPPHTGSRDTRIFVQIPAYRDSELAPTLVDLYAKAARPDSLRVAVLWQHGPEETLPPEVYALPNVEIHGIPSKQSRGCNWARSVIQKHWRDEPYTLLIDSHHRFQRGWDQTLVRMHKSLEEQGVPRPLLTAYMPPYEPHTYPRRKPNAPYKIYPAEREKGLLIHLTSYPIPSWDRLQAPIPATFVSGHFLFARGRFNQEVPFDPKIYFTGDEVSIALRAYTSGYDLFHPHVVIGWHCYNRQSRVTHWHDHSRWRGLHQESLNRVRRLFMGRLRGRFGPGKRRKTSGYESKLLVALIDESRA